MVVRVVLAGDTMLGRGVGDRLATGAAFEELFSPAVRGICADADACVLNLECCVSDRGERWAAPGKPFFFRAPPRAAALLSWLGIGCVTLANNHALDYGSMALLDTLAHLRAAGIAVTGAGPDEDTARDWRALDAGGKRLGVLGVTDHPADFAATATSPGVAYADLHRQVPDWLVERIAAMAAETDLALVMPHWGPNMTSRPVPHVRAAAPILLAAGATLVAGHSAHVFHGAHGPVLYDLGDFIDDYAVDPHLRNDLGLLFEVTVDDRGPVHVEAVPLALDYCHTRLARAREADWIGHRFAAACAELGSTATAVADGRWRVPLR
ncbi:CapA family protein [Catellatospora tritici]|uniref:CapA family protein n=1 Tax=Catellatospora tritici TaxID=2851566 RepID=UPI001C2D306F|nr:CapA family protein [Catellatospora tritici]MBV1849307.1 CapA family protein [Catellatospora tritici]